AVKGNWIGVNITGAAALPNGLGILLTGSPGNVQSPTLAIGGPNAGEGNVISGNLSSGIRHANDGGGGSVEGNLIGIAPDGVTPMGNGSHGIEVTVSS